MSRSSYYLIITCLTVLALMLCAIYLCIGPMGWSASVWSQSNANNHAITIYRAVRLILVIIAGSSLAISGISLQAMFRNPLADPHLFGISGGAAVGAGVVICFFSNHPYISPSYGAIAGSLCAFALLSYCFRLSSNMLGQYILLGVLINSVAAAIITLLKTTLAANKTQSLLYWLVGHIGSVETKSLLFIIPLWLISTYALYYLRGPLEILSFGTDEAELLGINSSSVIRVATIANCILIGNVVSFAGMIGFLGLVIPHLVRMTIANDLRIALPISGIIGAMIMVFFDCLSRSSFLIFSSEVPTGALAALFLSPLFFLLLIKQKNYE